LFDSPGDDAFADLAKIGGPYAPNVSIFDLLNYLLLYSGEQMDTKRMLGEVEAEIAKLQRVAAALRGTEPNQTSSRSRGQGVSVVAHPITQKRTISAASRKRMAAAQKARWAKVKAQQKKAA
jgi:hypothetical protein